MKPDRTAAVLLGLLILAPCGGAMADQETERLRLENRQLKAQLQALQQSCPTPAASAAAPAVSGVAVPAAAAVPASTIVEAPAAPAQPAVAAPPPAAVAAAPAPPAKPAEAVAVPQQAAVSQAAAVVVPQGYKLVPVNTPEVVDPLAPPYNRTGCSRDLFKGPPPAKWNDASNWSGLRRGLSTAEVEAVLGKEHYDVSGRGRVEWQYGKCGDSVAGRVQFQDGQVVFWQVPDL